MTQITKQPALPEKKVYMEKEVFGYKSTAESFNNFFASVFVQDYSEVVIPFNQMPEIFFDDIHFSKVALSGETKYIHSGANSFDGINPKILKSFDRTFRINFCSSSVAVLANVSFQFVEKNACTTSFHDR